MYEYDNNSEGLTCNYFHFVYQSHSLCLSATISLCYFLQDMVLLQVYVIPDLPFTLCTAGDTVSNINAEPFWQA